ncbi:hypothetical protein PTTG_25310 [Puccinia triticina 1-1 BBBD Race 1]|uniref:Uncharacterized protein n=1 Tax=Puccinia triticina (isolate 1-1 / race 1 (BBBD)) TaxID=630390 RepID=A0A180H588_PUCT1|nr:hypothetical protein PTTG_25310 [Puccinia triticina 1-1 BBBD Race 1]WAR53175.1 hypothetical protein PtB15_2B606 [Puccinia triticina]
MADQTPKIDNSNNKNLSPHHTTNHNSPSISQDEQNIIDILAKEQYNTPKTFTQISSDVPMKFDIDYDYQAESLELELQRLRESPKSSELSFTLMNPFEINQNGLKVETDRQLSDLFGQGSRQQRSRLQSKRLAMYSEPTIQMFFDRWGKDVVARWEHKRLDISFMVRFALQLNLDHQEAHYGISPEYKDTIVYERFKEMTGKERNQAIDEIHKILGKTEGTRRLFAFLRTLRYHSISRNWTKLKQSWIREGMMTGRQAANLEKRFGLSEDPGSIVEIPTSTLGPRASKTKKDFIGKLHVVYVLNSIYGGAKGKERLLLTYYLHERSYPRRWWTSFDLETASREFGVDILSMLLIGDALQFGSKNLQDSVWDRWRLERAYSDMMLVVDEGVYVLPWVESAERAWLYRNCGQLYQDRVRELSLRVHGRGGMGNYRGTELIWADLGLNVKILNEYYTGISGTGQSEVIKHLHGVVEDCSEYEKLAYSTWHSDFCLVPPNPHVSTYRVHERFAFVLAGQLEGIRYFVRHPWQSLKSILSTFTKNGKGYIMSEPAKGYLINMLRA